jgi:two-component system OmpR family sensor kinase
MSLRARLIVAMAVVGVVLVLAAIAITTTTESHLLGQLDDRLQEVAVRQQGFGQPGPRPGDFREDTGPISSFFVALVDTTGAREVHDKAVSKDGYQPDPNLPVDDIANLAPGQHAYYSVSSDGGPRYRVLATRPTSGQPAIVVATTRNDVDNAIRRLITVEVLATAAIVAVLALVTFWVIRLGVRPIKQMTATASGIAGGDLATRVPEAPTGTEAGELGVALNQMLGRIEEAFDERTRSENRLRRFVGDASHELRTPVTTIRGYAELYRAGGLEEGDELREAMRRTEQEAIRMGRLVDDLLLLARLDQGRPLEQAPVHLEVLVEDAVRDARAVDPQREIIASIDQRATVLGDDGRLRQVVGNLVRNALVHTPEGTPVTVRVDRTTDTAILEVHDDGPGMSEDVAAQAFERFYRADPSRVRSRGGSGLGLAIVEATVNAHGGTVVLDTGPGRGTTVRIELPAAPNGEAPSARA